jgi:hypothetical protein
MNPKHPIACLASTTGRIVRVALAVVLISFAFSLGAGWWLLLLIPAALFLATAALDICLLAPLFGLPFRGKEIASCTLPQAEDQ